MDRATWRRPLSSVELVHWNPRRKVLKGRLSSRIPLYGPRVRNFGDLLGPRIVRHLLQVHDLDANAAQRGPRRLVSVGSIMHLSRDNDVIWGTGVNGKQLGQPIPRRLDIRAVRGPLTHGHLTKRNHHVPEVYGDPGLLVGVLWPHLKSEEKRYPLTVVPNLNDLPSYGKSPEILNPRSDLDECLTRIARSEFVVGSSLHAIIVADSLGIPSRLISSPVEPGFKYEDYYLGSGRSGFRPARTVNQALDLGAESPADWDPTSLLEAFPYDLWESSNGNGNTFARSVR